MFMYHLANDPEAIEKHRDVRGSCCVLKIAIIGVIVIIVSVIVIVMIADRG